MVYSNDHSTYIIHMYSVHCTVCSVQCIIYNVPPQVNRRIRMVVPCDFAYTHPLTPHIHKYPVNSYPIYKQAHFSYRIITFTVVSFLKLDPVLIHRHYLLIIHRLSLELSIYLKLYCIRCID